jgi:hypothetical protein
MVKCRCGCNTIFNETQGYYNIPQVGAIKCECYDRIVPLEHRGTFQAIKIIQDYVKK